MGARSKVAFTASLALLVFVVSVPAVHGAVGNYYVEGCSIPPSICVRSPVLGYGTVSVAYRTIGVGGLTIDRSYYFGRCSLLYAASASSPSTSFPCAVLPDPFGRSSPFSAPFVSCTARDPPKVSPLALLSRTWA